MVRAVVKSVSDEIKIKIARLLETPTKVGHSKFRKTIRQNWKVRTMRQWCDENIFSGENFYAHFVTTCLTEIA